MKSLLFAILLMLAAFCSRADDRSTTINTVPLASYHFNGDTYLCSAPESKFLQGPHWSDYDTEPPLSPRRALALARVGAIHAAPNLVNARPQGIVLKRFAGVWYYVVELEPLNQRAPHVGGPMEHVLIPVLMDGTVIEGIKQ